MDKMRQINIEAPVNMRKDIKFHRINFESVKSKSKIKLTSVVFCQCKPVDKYVEETTEVSPKQRAEPANAPATYILDEIIDIYISFKFLFSIVIFELLFYN